MPCCCLSGHVWLNAGQAPAGWLHGSPVKPRRTVKACPARSQSLRPPPPYRPERFLIRQAIADGVEWVIGAAGTGSRSAVWQQCLNLPLPTLALNYAESSMPQGTALVQVRPGAPQEMKPASARDPGLGPRPPPHGRADRQNRMGVSALIRPSKLILAGARWCAGSRAKWCRMSPAHAGR